MPINKLLVAEIFVVEAFPKVTRPVRLIPPLPPFKLRVVTPVVLPTVTVFPFEFVPILIAPVEPESRFRFPVVPDVIFKSDPAADVRASVVPPAMAVAPEPVIVAEEEATLKRVLPPVIKFRPYASVVPRDAALPKALPFCSKA